jgi:hypothetical protein
MVKEGDALERRTLSSLKIVCYRDMDIYLTIQNCRCTTNKRKQCSVKRLHELSVAAEKNKAFLGGAVEWVVAFMSFQQKIFFHHVTQVLVHSCEAEIYIVHYARF